MRPDRPPAKDALIARPGSPLRGRARAPGDKSISHRALIFGALAEGVTDIEGLLEGDDVARTAVAMRALGAGVERTGLGRWRVEGRGALAEPAEVVDCGNAGTAARLILGAAAAFPIALTLTGDASLRGRPMNRVLEPLGRMGARWLGRQDGRLPLTLRGGDLVGLAWRPPQPSAQVKSAVLLAGLGALGETRVIEAWPTRDHTERLLRRFGAELEIRDTPEGRLVALPGGQTLAGAHVRVPGDPSSAAFLLVAALIVPGSAVTVEGVLLNPLRTGLFETLREMGADLEIDALRDEGGEAVGDVTARHSALRGVVAPPERAASMIDEYPILAVAAAFAEGPTTMRGVGELRVKESDRIAAMAAVLAACGVDVEEEADGLIVGGASAGGRGVKGAAAVRTLGDHRIAMSSLVLGLAAREPVAVDDAAMIATSFPDFAAILTGLGADLGAP
ncbi:MAG: 3-phosphoshikimate 1-carboxyvinyltransferase [Caulobacteraceae bacterium]